MNFNENTLEQAQGHTTVSPKADTQLLYRIAAEKTLDNGKLDYV